jgi:hypothetical protein
MNENIKDIINLIDSGDRDVRRDFFESDISSEDLSVIANYALINQKYAVLDYIIENYSLPLSVIENITINLENISDITYKPITNKWTTENVDINRLFEVLINELAYHEDENRCLLDSYIIENIYKKDSYIENDIDTIIIYLLDKSYNSRLVNLLKDPIILKMLSEDSELPNA